MKNTITPTIRSPPPTNCPKVFTTFPGSPVRRISLVDDILSDILNIVVKSKIVGKLDISSASLENIALKRTIIASERFTASSTSRSTLGIGIINIITVRSIKLPIPKLALFPI